MAPQAIEFGHRQEQAIRKVELQIRQLPAGAPQAPQLRPQPIPIQAGSTGHLQGSGTQHLQGLEIGCGERGGREHTDLQGFPDTAQHLQGQRTGALRGGLAGQTLRLPLQRRITAEPAGTSRSKHGEGQPGRTETHGLTSGPAAGNGHHPTTHFLGRGKRITAQCLEYHSVARLESFRRAQHTPAARLQRLQPADQRPPLLAPASVHEPAMVDAREPSRGQAPGKHQLQAAAVVAGEG